MADTEGKVGYRWTVSEYVMRIEQGRDLREILVEGPLDRDVIARVAESWGLDGLTVVESDYLHVTPADVDAAGQAKGVKGLLLSVACGLRQVDPKETLAGRVVVVVDRDYDDEQLEESFVLRTDGHSIETYALDPIVLQRFVEQVLGRSARPPGADGSRPERTSCTGRELYEKLLDALSEITGVRFAARASRPPLQVGISWLKYAKVDRSGFVEMDGRLLLENLVRSRGSMDQLEVLEHVRVEKAASASTEPRRLVRGHDFVELLGKLLRSPWGRSRNGKAAAGDDPNHLGRLLLFSAQTSKLEEEPLFTRLRQRFA